MAIINPQAITSLCEKDHIFSAIIEKYGEAPNWERPEGFETLARIILEQQVSLESAQAAYQRLKQKLSVFAPTAILQLSDEEMRACSVSRQKTRYIKALAQAILNGDLDLEQLPTLPTETAKTELKKIVGIGEWTAKIYLMFCLQKEDIFPEGDIAAINTVKELWQAKSKEEVLEITKKWSPYRSAATYLLWHYYLCKRGRKAVL